MAIQAFKMYLINLISSKSNSQLTSSHSELLPYLPAQLILPHLLGMIYKSLVSSIPFFVTCYISTILY